MAKNLNDVMRKFANYIPGAEDRLTFAATMFGCAIEISEYVLDDPQGLQKATERQKYVMALIAGNLFGFTSETNEEPVVFEDLSESKLPDRERAIYILTTLIKQYPELRDV
jgi:hypothetical protein